MDFLDLADDYEEEAYGEVVGLQICQHHDCRDPRRGPFVSFDGEPLCLSCFRIYVLGQDPNDVID